MKFYRDFAAAYGTLWLLMVIISIITMSHVNTGEFGLIGFPLISIIYAFIARHRRNVMPMNSNIEYALFLKMFPAYKDLPIEDQAVAFANWRSQFHENIKRNIS